MPGVRTYSICSFCCFIITTAMDTARSQLETARNDCGNLIELNFVLIGQTVFSSIYSPEGEGGVRCSFIFFIQLWLFGLLSKMCTHNNTRKTSVLVVTVPDEGIFLENKCLKSISTGNTIHGFEQDVRKFSLNHLKGWVRQMYISQ